jgi:DinB superfamily
MNHSEIIESLAKNAETFRSILSGVTEKQYRWKPAPEKWNLLEVVCHLYDEEREDFHARLMHTLETPHLPLPPSNPQAWVKDRKYAEQNYLEMLQAFLDERKQTIEWLRSLSNPDWNIAYQHPTHGALTAEMFLANWLAHDYLHLRQIVSLKYHYLVSGTNVSFDYAGEW